MVVGIYLGQVYDLPQTMKDIEQMGFSYVCGNIVNSAYRAKALQGTADDGAKPFGWFDMDLERKDWQNSVVGILSDVHPKIESSNQTTRTLASELIKKELGYAQHLDLRSTILNLPSGDASNLCRLINSKLSQEGFHFSQRLWIRVPTSWQAAGDGSVVNSWNLWNNFRNAMNDQCRIRPILDLTQDLPDKEEVRRWLGEPVKAICLNENHFVMNPQGYPELTSEALRIVQDFIGIGAHVILNCAPGKRMVDYVPMKDYIDHLFRVQVDEWDANPMAKLEDYLQCPLQPLMDNLDSNTYETFERDVMKYKLYEEAIGKALLAKVPEEEKNDREVICMVVGAGRGPLVRNCFNAAAATERKVKIYAVEKNVNAFCTLLHLNRIAWSNSVTVVNVDMREWDTVVKADIMISELLGSFGDNELSPECLDGAQKFLKEDGIMIPQSYTSWLAPVMSPRFHYDLKRFVKQNKHQLAAYETPCVVLMKNFYTIDKPKELFKFEHPNREAHSNNRYKTLHFKAQDECLLHGLAGYFDCELFDGVKLSIVPDTKTRDMYSWFPMYIPIKEPLLLKEKEKIEVGFWRCSNKHNVWYEWLVGTPANPGAIHNVNGRSSTIGL